jgi:hypothetical protein
MRLRTDFSWSAMTFLRTVIPLYLLTAHDLFGKPVSAIPDHALAAIEYRPCEGSPQADRVPILTIDYR